MKKKTTTRRKKTPAKISNAGLSEALGFNQFGGSQLSQSDTLFKNLRWYMVSNMRQLLSESYVETGLIQTVIDVPVEDAFRGGVEIKTKQLSPEELAELQGEIERQGDMTVQAQAEKWNRLFGGAGVVIITDQDPSTPLDIESLNADRFELRAVDMWELFYSLQNTDDYSKAIDGRDISDVEFYDYYGMKLHKSRVLRLKGLEAPSFVRPRLRGWGFSVVESLVRSINQYLKATDLSFEVLDEFKVDIFKIEGLNNSLLSDEGTRQIQRRLQIANQQKNYQTSLAMDKNDEYEQKQVSFTGISEIMEGIRMQVASDLRMPLTKIFGISAAGFSSGQDDIENYNAMIESTIRQKSKFNILKIIELRCQVMFGFIPDDLEISFKPLRVMSAEQEENVKSQKFARLMQAVQAGLISTEDFRDACNKDNLLGIQLDPDERVELIKADSVSDTPANAPTSTKTAPEAVA